MSTPKRISSEVALINAAGTSLAAGALTTVAVRSYTPSWSHAGVLGACGAILAMFFIAPRLVENTSLVKQPKKVDATEGLKKDAVKATLARESLKPTRKLIPFRQQF